jgi:sugar (pentulose or hexulose) kinase
MPPKLSSLRSSEIFNVAAILDLGKTRAKITLLSEHGEELAARDASMREFARSHSEQLPIVALTKWCDDMLVELYRAQPFTHLIAVTHGATAAALDASGKYVLVPDYEAEIDRSISSRYESLRPDFARTGSPSLPLGLNLGRQLFALRETGALTDITRLLTYPQYWTWLWSGALGTDASSLGCHTDLWEPHNSAWSSLAVNYYWDAWFPPLIKAGSVAGTLRGELARRLNATQPIKVHWGLHDSNAALASFLGKRNAFTVLSTGTWAIAFAVGAKYIELDASRDTLWNVDIYERPVASTRFMAGREREAIAGNLPNADVAALKALLQTDALVLPSFAPAGAFPSMKGEIIASCTLSEVQRAALASLYLALMIDASLDLISSSGDIIVEGPLAKDRATLSALAALRPQQSILTTQINCVAYGAAKLIFSDVLPEPTTESVTLDIELIPLLNDRRKLWHQLIEERIR